MEQKEELQQTVYDAENNKWVTVSPDMKQRAMNRQMLIAQATSIAAIALKEMLDTREYLALGYQTTVEYINEGTPFSVSVAYRLCRAAAKFQPISNLLSHIDLKQIGSSESLEKLSTSTKTLMDLFEELGTSKFYELTKLEDAEFDELIRTGKVNLNGGELALNEIRDWTARETSKQINQLKKKYSSKINEQEEAIKLLKEENKVLSKEAQAAQAALDAANKDLKVFGPVKVKIQEKEDQLTDARKLLIQFNRVVVRADVKPDDPEELRSMVEEIFRELVEVKDRVMNYYDEVLATTESKGFEWTPDPEKIRMIKEKTKHLK